MIILVISLNFTPTTLKISVLEVDTRNEILSFFYFLFCLQNSKKKILISSYCLQMFLGTLGHLLSSQNNFQKVYEEIVDKKSILVA